MGMGRMELKDGVVPPLGGRRLGDVRLSIHSLQRSVEERDAVVGRRSFRFLVLASLNALDLLTTAVVLRLGGTEANPIMAPHVDSAWRAIAVKSVVLALVWVALVNLPGRERVVDRVVEGAIVIYGAVVVYNTLLYLSIG